MHAQGADYNLYTCMLRGWITILHMHAQGADYIPQHMHEGLKGVMLYDGHLPD